MPYESAAQRRFFNSPTGKAKIGAAEVAKWNAESKGQKNLPEKVATQSNIKTGKSLQSMFARK